jgi:PAS domain-containing protein
MGLLLQITRVIFDLLDNLTDSIIALDSEMNITYANPSQAALWKLNRKEMINKNIYEIIPRLAERLFDDRILEALSKNEITEVNWKIIETDQLVNSTIFPSPEGFAMVSRIAKTPQAASKPP